MILACRIKSLWRFAHNPRAGSISVTHWLQGSLLHILMLEWEVGGCASPHVSEWQHSLNFDSPQGNNAAKVSLTEGDETGW